MFDFGLCEEVYYYFYVARARIPVEAIKGHS